MRGVPTDEHLALERGGTPVAPTENGMSPNRSQENRHDDAAINEKLEGLRADPRHR